MSWLFGKKKQKDSPPPPEESEVQFMESTSNNGFTYITKNEDSQVTGPASLYPPVPDMYPQNSGEFSRGPDLLSNSKDSGGYPSFDSYLSGVPFKLCKQLETTMNSDLEIDRLRINEILAYIDRIEGQNFDYSFSLEKSVVNEMSSNDQ